MNQIEVSKTVICYGCWMNCRVRAVIKNGRLTRVEKVPGSSRSPCERCKRAPEWVYHKDRLTHPLKRVGEKGEGKWQRISWNEVLDEIASKIGEIIKHYGPEAVASSQGTGRTVDHIRRRFMNLLGSPNIVASGTQVCYGNDHVIEALTYGRFIQGGDMDNAKSIVEWAGNPAQSFIPRWQKIVNAKRRGAKLIVVDPRFTRTAQMADCWLQIRPGTDTALLMAWLNIIIRDGLYDRDFVEKWTIGFDKLCERVQEYPPEKVAEITEVPVEKIVSSARMYGTNQPGVIEWRVPLDGIGRNATQAVRARAILRAIMGSLDIMGGHPYSGPHPKVISEAELEENDKLALEQRKKQLGADRFRLFSWEIYDLLRECAKKVGWRGTLPSAYICKAHAPTLWRAILSDKPYPVKGLITVANNPLVDNANTKLVYQALRKLELFVVHDYFMTPSAMLADYVLPAATWLERPFLNTAFGAQDIVVACDKAIEPVGESLSDFDFFRELGIRLGQSWPWKNLEELYNYQLSGVGYSFSEFVEKIGKIIPSPEYKKYERTGFATPSGKVEIYSAVFEKYGYAPLPRYEEPAESKVSTPELAKEFPLILVTGGRFRPMYHSEYRQVKSLRQKHPDPLVEVHPETAKSLGINDGDWVWIETPLGRAKQRAKLFEGIRRDCVHSEHGWWLPETDGREPNLFGIWNVNINVVVDDSLEKCNPEIGGWQLKNLLCKIYKV